MRILPPPEPSMLTAFFCAPLITPILAIPLVALLPGIYNNEIDLLITLPFVIIISLLYGYLGMVLICLPVMLLLRFLKRLNALSLCLCTAVIGASVWTLLFGDMPGPNATLLLRTFLTGFGCSLGVSAFFCVLGGITIRSSRAQSAVRAESA